MIREGRGSVRGGREGRERERIEEGRGKVKEEMGGTGQDMGWDGGMERESRKGREREERGYSPNFNSWRHHWVGGIKR